MDEVEVDEIMPSTSTHHNGDEGTDEGEHDDSMEDTSDEESINLFVDLNIMGFDMDSYACRDLLADEN